MALERLTTVLAIDLRPDVRMRAFMATQVRELCIGFGTELNRETDRFDIEERRVSRAYLAFPWFHAGVNVSMLFEARRRLKALATIVARVETIFTFAGFT